MKITPQILSIPPFISTTWKNISTLHIREEAAGPVLIVTLQNRIQIEVPDLERDTIDAIFEAHSRYAEMEGPGPAHPLDGAIRFSLPLKSDGGIIDSLGASLQHNPEQANLPPLPPELLEKIVAITHGLGIDDTSHLPDPETDCLCLYCQMARALKGEPAKEEEIAEADLRFRDWEVSQKGTKLYQVINPLDQNEHYDVFLGEPLGCTCGSKNCEHIKAVLRS